MVAAVLIELLVRKNSLHSYQIIAFCVLIPSVILHEISHGAVAYLFGDDTAKRAGRLTLNPIPHIDPLGSVILPGIMALTGYGVFGWAKPVPVDIGKLRHPRNEAVLVGLVGPMVNIAIAFAMAMVFRTLASPALAYAVSHYQGALPTSLGLEIVYLAGFVNVILAAFNLIPIPPLDGSAVIERFLPASVLPTYYRFRTAMIVVVFALVFLAPSALNTVFNHALSLWGGLIGSGAGPAGVT